MVALKSEPLRFSVVAVPSLLRAMKPVATTSWGKGWAHGRRGHGAGRGQKRGAGRGVGGSEGRSGPSACGMAVLVSKARPRSGLRLHAGVLLQAHMPPMVKVL